MEYKKYAYGIVVAAGLSITGTLWYERANSPYIRGEDIAALAAGLQERQAYAFFVDGQEEELVFPSNSVTPYILMGGPTHTDDNKVRVLHDVLWPTRKLAFSGYGTLEDYYNHGILWLDTDWEPPGDGEVLVSGRGVWEYEEEYPIDNSTEYVHRKWGFTQSNHVDSVMTLSTRVYSPDVYYWSVAYGYESMYGFEILYTNHAAFAEMFYTGDNPDIEDSPYTGGNWWTHNGFGTNVYKWDAESPTNRYSEPARWGIRTNDLYQAKTVLTAMRRTAVFLRNDLYASCTSAVTTTYQCTNWPVFFVSSVATSAPPAYIPDIMADVYVDYTHRVDTYTPEGGDPITTEETFVYGGGTEVKCLGCSLPYPSEAAISSGKVSRIRIYAVCFPTDSAMGGWGYPKGTNWSLVAYSGSAQQPGDIANKTFGVVNALCPVPEPPQAFINEANSYDYTLWGQVHNIDWDIVGNVVVDVSNPSTIPLFDFTADFSFTEDEAFGYDMTWSLDEEESGASYTEQETYREYEAGVSVSGFLVIVDWNWEYP